MEKIPVGETPHGVWPSGDDSRMYVVLEDAHALAVIDTSGMEVIKTIPIGQQPRALVYVPDAVSSGGGAENLEKVRIGLPVKKFELVVPHKGIDNLG